MCFMLHGTGTHMFKSTLSGKRLTYFTGEEPDIHTGERVPKFTAQLSRATGPKASVHASPHFPLVWWCTWLALGGPGGAGLFLCLSPYLLYREDLKDPKAGKTLKTISDLPTILLFLKISVTKSSNFTTKPPRFREVLSLV